MSNMEAFGSCVTVDNLEAARRFYTSLYPHDHVMDGEAGGIQYLSLIRDTEVVLNIFLRTPAFRLADTFTTLKVDSVPEWQERVIEFGGKVLTTSALCPCTEAPFAICEDPLGNQFMIKESRRNAVCPPSTSA